jgi:hypothetical protein
MSEGNTWFLSRQLFERVVVRLNSATAVDAEEFSADLQANRSRLFDVLKNPVCFFALLYVLCRGLINNAHL